MCCVVLRVDYEHIHMCMCVCVVVSVCKQYVRGFTGSSSSDADENARASRPEAAAAIPTLMRAQKVLAPCDEHLTPIQPLLLLCCLLSKHYGFAARTLLDAAVITEMEPKETAVSQTDFLLYCYYGYGCVSASRMHMRRSYPVSCIIRTPDCVIRSLSEPSFVSLDADTRVYMYVCTHIFLHTCTRVIVYGVWWWRWLVIVVFM